VSFSLLDDPWIPVREGQSYYELSLLEALRRAGEISLAADPYEEVPSLRFLLFSLAWALQGLPLEEALALSPSELAARVEARLRPFAPRLDLFQEFFAFCPDLPGKPGGVEVLRPDWPSGGGGLLTTPRPVHPVALEPSEVARAVLVALSYTPGTLHKQHGVTALSGGPLSSGVAFYALGENLLSTLRLNLSLPVEPLTAPWEEAPLRYAALEGYALAERPHLLRRYLAVAFSFRPFWNQNRLVGVVRGPGLDPKPLQSLRDPMFAYEGERALSLLPGQRLLERTLPRFAGVTPPEVLERAEALAWEPGISYAVRAVGQAPDYSVVPALLSALLPPVLRSEEAFRLRLGARAKSLGDELTQVTRGLYGKRKNLLAWASLTALKEGLERAVLEAADEEAGDRRLYATARSFADELLLERLSRPEELLPLQRALDKAIARGMRS
jgi:hypothetical protein